MADGPSIPESSQPPSPGLFANIKNTTLLTWNIFSEIEAEQRAAAFTYYAFFSLIPLLTLLIVVGSLFIPSNDSIVEFVNYLVPLEKIDRTQIWDFVNNLEKARGGISIISILIFFWASFRFFQSLVRAVNRVWHTTPMLWWQVPIKDVTMIAIFCSGILIGLVAPAIIQSIRVFAYHYFPAFALNPILITLDISRYAVGTFVLFYCFALFYMTAPRQRLKFRQVWVATLVVTVLLQILQIVFVKGLSKFLLYNVIYGTVGTFMFLLLWIYFSGLIIIAGACFSAARAKINGTFREEDAEPEVETLIPSTAEN